MGKVKFSGYTRRNKREKKEIPFVITYHPSLKNIGRIINQILCILYMNEDLQRVFTPALMTSFQSARKLSSYLVITKLYPLERTVGLVQCKGKRCQTCYNVKETETFTSTTMGKTFLINRKLDCNDKCLVYLLTCNMSMAHVCSNTFSSIFMSMDTIVFWCP